GYLWVGLNAAGVAGSFAISAFGYRKTGIRTFDFRMLIAFVLFFAFGFLCTSVLGHFTPRQMGTFWPIYFMLLYVLAGLWFGHAFVAIGLSISALALAGYFWAGDLFDLWMVFFDGGGLVRGGLLMPRSGQDRARRHHSSTAAAANHGGAERAAIGRGARIRQAEATDRRHRRQCRGQIRREHA